VTDLSVTITRTDGTSVPGIAITDPEMEATYFGIPVVYYGEDGDMLALGHHDPRRAIAAFNRHARKFCGLLNLEDHRHAQAQHWLDGVTHAWFVFTRPNPDEGDDPDYVWYAVPATAGNPNAVPVTLLTAA
jgi:hypothetical protein